MTTFSWHGRRVTVVAAFDSFLKSATFYARHLESLGAIVRYRIVFARPDQISRHQLDGMNIRRDQLKTLPLDALVTPAALGREDVVLLALNGLRTRRFMVRLHHRFRDVPRPVVMSFYPGLIFRFHFEGMLSRMAADVLALNSPHDLELYEQALAGMGLDNRNAICAGLSFLPSKADAIEHAVPPDGAVLFVGQPTVPAGEIERRYVLERLLELARRHPNRQWLLKPRHRRNETTLHQVDHHFEDLLSALDPPPNFQVVHESMSTLLQRTRLCLTFSSTAALEAVLLGIPTRILTDVGVHENVGNHFFLGSDMLCVLDEVHPTLDLRVDQHWLERHAIAAGDQMEVFVDALAQRIQARRDGCLPPPYPRLFGRSHAYEDYLTRECGWESVASFGARGASRRAKFRRLTRPLASALRAVLVRR